MPNTKTTAIREALPGEFDVDTSLVDDVVAAVTQIHLARGLEYHLELGQLLLDRFFGGDAAEYAKRGSKHRSYRSLSARTDLPVSHVTLWNAVRVAHQYRQLPLEVQAALTMAHHKALFPLTNEKVRQRLALKVVERGLNSGELRLEVAKALKRSRANESRGRPTLPQYVKTVNLFRRVLEDANAFGGLDSVDELDDEQADVLFQTLAGMKLKCADLQQRIQDRDSSDAS